jgi:F-type H+-transporting ATPase subunit epsilon
MKLAGELSVELVAPDRRVWSGTARMVIARTAEGEIGILPGHEPVLALLVTGQVTIRTTGDNPTPDNTVLAAVHGGFLSVSDDTVSILAEVAELSGEIDVARAETALGQAADGEGDDDARRRAETRLRVAGAR